jgi:hypothetical protein
MVESVEKYSIMIQEHIILIKEKYFFEEDSNFELF